MSKKAKKEYTLQGLVFWPEKVPKNFYPSVYKWATEGRPDNAIVYDTVDVLIDCNIKICDAVEFNGLYRKIPVYVPADTRAVRLSKRLVVVTRPAKAVKKVDGILKADAQAHHKMNYL